MLKTYKFRLYPKNEEQIILLNKSFGCVRFIYNKMLNDAMNYYEENNKLKINTPASYKEEFPFLKEVDSLVLCNARINLKRAYNNFFSKQNDFPTLKKKSNHYDSFTTNNVKGNVRIEGNYIRLPKIGKIKVRFHRTVEGKIKSVTVTRKPSGRYFISILVETDNHYEELPKTGKKVGIDLGLKENFATLSDGLTFSNEKLLSKNLDRLALLEQRLSNKQKGSKNREKARIKVAKLSEKISNQRDNYLEQLTSFVVKNYDVIVIEDLSVLDMKSEDKAKRKRSNINRITFSSGLRKFRDILVHKCNKFGKTLIIADKYYASSQVCSNCGSKNPEVKNLDVRKWICPVCNTKHDRDINAAINLLKLA